MERQNLAQKDEIVAELEVFFMREMANFRARNGEFSIENAERMENCL